MAVVEGARPHRFRAAARRALELRMLRDRPCPRPEPLSTGPRIWLLAGQPPVPGVGRLGTEPPAPAAARSPTARPVEWAGHLRNRRPIDPAARGTGQGERHVWSPPTRAPRR